MDAFGNTKALVKDLAGKKDRTRLETVLIIVLVLVILGLTVMEMYFAIINRISAAGTDNRANFSNAEITKSIFMTNATTK